MTEHQPQGPTETDLVHQLVIASWRLRRLRAMETGLFELHLIDCDEDVKEDYTGLGTQERLAYAFAHHAENFNNLARYEGPIERSFYRALHELQRLNAGRAGQPVPPPQVIEINAPENEGLIDPVGIVPSTAQGGSEPCAAGGDSTTPAPTASSPATTASTSSSRPRCEMVGQVPDLPTAEPPA